MSNLDVNRIKDLLASALGHAREADFSALAFIIEIALAEIAELGKSTSIIKLQHRIPTPVSEDRPLDVIGGLVWDIVNKVVYADPNVALIYNVAPEAAERGIPQDEFGAAIFSDDMPDVAEAVSHAMEGGGFSVVYRLLQADGSLKAVLAVGRAVIRNDHPVSFPCTIIDVTDDEVRRVRGMKYRIPGAPPDRASG
jgi:PAS domain-containing protein